MNSFVTTKHEHISSNNPITTKSSSSFIFPSKSPLNTAKNTASQNFILKNKRSVRNMHTSGDETRRKLSKGKKSKRNLSKKSIGSVNKKSSYSTSKIKGSFTNKAHDNVSVVKYNSFINSCKVSPTRNKSNEKLPKKSHRKLDMNIKKSMGCHRKRSICSGAQKSSRNMSTVTTTHKKSTKQLTRNPSKTDGFESNYSALMETYTELMAKKRKGSKKGSSKDLSKSFHMHQKKPDDRKKCYIQNYIKTVNKYLDKENISINKTTYNKENIKPSQKNSLNRFYFRRNTAD